MSEVVYVLLAVFLALAVGYWLGTLRRPEHPTPQTATGPAWYSPVVDFPIAERRTVTPEQWPQPKAVSLPLRMDYDVLRQELTDDPLGAGYAAFGQDYPTLANMLNDRPVQVIKNPDPQAQVPAPISMYDLLSCVTTEEALEIYKLTALKNDVEAAVAGGDRLALGAILTVVQGMFSPETQKALAELLALTVPDPAWTETVSVYGDSRATTLGLPEVKATDIQMVL